MKIKDILFMAAVATTTLTGCGSKESKVETTDFVDDVRWHLPIVGAST